MITVSYNAWNREDSFSQTSISNWVYTTHCTRVSSESVKLVLKTMACNFHSVCDEYTSLHGTIKLFKALWHKLTAVVNVCHWYWFLWQCTSSVIDWISSIGIGRVRIQWPDVQRSSSAFLRRCCTAWRHRNWKSLYTIVRDVMLSVQNFEHYSFNRELRNNYRPTAAVLQI